MSVCEICDREGPIQVTLHGYPMHLKCAPKLWVVDGEKHGAFMARVSLLAPSRLERWKKWR